MLLCVSVNLSIYIWVYVSVLHMGVHLYVRVHMRMLKSSCVARGRLARATVGIRMRVVTGLSQVANMEAS